MYQPPNPETQDCRVSGIGHTEFQIPDTRTPKPDTAGSRVSGVRNSELGTIWGDQFNLIHNQTYRVPSSGHPIPETRQSPTIPGFGGWTPGFGTRHSRNPEVETWDLTFDMRHLSKMFHSTFHIFIHILPTPEPWNCGLPGLGFRGSEVRNSELSMCKQKYISNMVPSAGTPEPRNPRLPGLGVRGSGTRNSFRVLGPPNPETPKFRVPGPPNPETRDCRVSGSGGPELGTRFQDSGFRDSGLRDSALLKPGNRNLGLDI
ncbi:hypothetical protein EV424DRAFT_1352894 [Suillus variegatus]|nr:hypothetical protein EV424DRAFT_1352894 [Suillus variegatus]